MRPERRGLVDGAAFAGLYVLSLIPRLASWRSHPWADEAAFYATIRTFGAGPENLYLLDAQAPYDANVDWLFWQRPVFSLLMWPAAVMGYDAFRLWHVALAAMIPVLGAAILRDRGVRPVLAFGAGAALALHPQFVLWGTRVFPDTLMTLAFGLGVWAHLRRRYGLAAVAFLLAVWAKEEAYPGVVLLLLYALASRAWELRSLPWPVRLGPVESAYVPGTILGLLPMWYALSLGGAFPGWNHGGAWGELLDRLFLTLWILPLVVLGLAWRRTRALSVAALVFPLFFVAYRLTGRGMGPNYYVVTAFLAVVAGAAALDAWWRVSRARSPLRFAGAPRAAALALVGILVASVLFPSTSGLNARVVYPAGGVDEAGLLQALAYEEERDGDLWRAVAVLDANDWPEVFVVDSAWFWPLHPFSEHAERLRTGATAWVDFGLAPDRIVATMEMSDVTLVEKHPSPFNEVLRAAYADCVHYENDAYVVLSAAGGCEGRLEAVRDGWEAARPRA